MDNKILPEGANTVQMPSEDSDGIFSDKFKVPFHLFQQLRQIVFMDEVAACRIDDDGAVAASLLTAISRMVCENFKRKPK